MKSSLTNNTHVTAIIDIGLDKGAYNKYCEHTTFLMIKNGNVTALDTTMLLDYTLHGGECLKHFELSSKSAPDYFILLESDHEMRCNINDLMSGLRCCIDHGVSIISLSMGTTQYYDADKFRDVQQLLDRSGTCLIAGASNSRHLSFPASLSCAIGVAVDYDNDTFDDRFVFINDSYDGVDVVLSSKLNSGTELDSNSMATAYFAGMVAGAIRRGEVAVADVREWVADNAGRIPTTSLYEYTRDSIVRDMTEDVIFVGIDGVSRDSYVNKFCEKLQQLFTESEYHCVTILPKNEAVRTSDFCHHKFVQPASSTCSYEDYVKLIIKLCKPSLALIDLESFTKELDVVICDESCSGEYGDAFVVNCTECTSKDIFEKIVDHFDDDEVK